MKKKKHKISKVLPGNLMFLFFHGVPFFLSFGYGFVHIRIITMITILRVKINKFLDGI